MTPKGSHPALRPRSASFGLAAVCASLVALAVTAAPAFADRTYDSQITGFSSPHGVAVDGSDNVWISDTGQSGLISEHDAYPSQTPIGQQDGGGNYGCSGNYIYSLDLNDTSGALYVADSCAVVVDIFDNTGAFSKQFASNFGGGYDHLAVDNSGGASSGDFYVSSTNSLVQKFDPSGNPVNFSGSAPYINGNQITGTPSGSLGQSWDIATDTAGRIYVIDQTQHVVDEFDSSGTFVRAFDGAGAPGGFSANLNGVAVDPTNGNVLVADSGNNVVDEFDPSGAYLEQLTGTGPSEATPFGSLPGGIAVNSSGFVYVADGSNHAVDIFTPNAILPKVTYGAVANQTQTAGTLNASVDLNGGADVTACSFQYGTTTAYGSSKTCSPSTPYSSNTSVSADLSGLTTETTYHYRLVLTTANGTKKAPDQTYLPHAVAGLTTDPATNVDRNTATLNASFNGDGEDTHYYFEWGTDTSYGNKTAVPPGADAGPVSGPQSLSFDLPGLTVETTYHYRIVASNAAGTSFGSDQSFKTLAAVENLSTDPASNITASTATLNASYTGIGEDVHYYFEYGPTNSYGSKSAVPPGTDVVGSPSGPQTLSFDVGQLQINAGYHYRVVATDNAGTTFGADQSFRTLGRYEFSTYYGSAGSGDGQLSNPQDVAVDNSNGDIYVADTGNHRIVKLDSSGNFLAAWGWGVSDGNAASEVCTSGCQAGISGSGAGQFATPKFIEVDNSTGPSTGDIYVADRADGVVQKFDPSGNLISNWGSAGAVDRSHDGTIGGITVDTVGNLFVLTDSQPYYWTEISQDGVSQSQTATNGVVHNSLNTPGGTGIDIGPTGTWYELQQSGVSSGGVYYTSPKAGVYASFAVYGQEAPTPANSGLTIDRSTGDLYVDQGTYIDQFAAAAGCHTYFLGCDSADTFGGGELSSAAGLTINPSTGVLYAANSGGNDIALFTALPVPDVATGSVTNPGPTSGTLNGHVDPNGAGSISDCHFEYVSTPFVDEVQTITLSGATGGTFKLGFEGQATGATGTGELTYGSQLVTGLTTATGTFAVGEAISGQGIPSGTTIQYVTSNAVLLSQDATAIGAVSLTADLPYNATPNAVQAALTSLSTIGSGSVTVSGGGPYTVEFKGSLSNTNVPQLSADSSGLTPPGAATTPATTTDGNGWGSAASVPCTPATPLSGATDVSANLTGLTPFTTYLYRLVATRADGKNFPRYGRDQTFTPAPGFTPAVDATSSSDLAPTSATLGAQINPNLAATMYRFQYGTSTGYGSQTLPSDSIGSDGVDHAVSNALTDLQPGTTYHFRVVAINFNGPTNGPDQTFTTPDLPAIAASSASNVTQTGATLSASVRAGFRATTYHFEYGLTDSYGSSTPESASIGSDNLVHPAAAAISGLQPETTYHFRIVATNAIGTTAGPAQTFTTAANTPVVTPPPSTCKAGFIKRGGKCVKRHHKRRHHRRSH